MLVLTRHVNQSVIITIAGHEVKVVLLDTPRDGKARLGFEADESVKVYREELYAQIQQERVDADHHAADRPFGVGIPD